MKVKLEDKDILEIIKKDKEQIQKVKKASATRSTLMAAARKGDEDAIETLTLEDMDMYTTISKRIQNEDVFSLVDTYFMPYGVECDQYSILGEIIESQKVALFSLKTISRVEPTETDDEQ